MDCLNGYSSQFPGATNKHRAASRTSLFRTCAMIHHMCKILCTVCQSLQSRQLCQVAYTAQAKVPLTWCVNDGEIWTELVLNLDNNFLSPELLFSLQPCILTFYVVLQIPCKMACMTVVLCAIFLNTDSCSYNRQSTSTALAIRPATLPTSLPARHSPL